MNEQLIKDNKEKLLAEQGRIRTILGHNAKEDGKGEFPGEFKPVYEELGRDESESSQEVEQFGTNLALTQDLEKKLEKVEAALKRIEEGVYGKCLMGDEIEEDRLRALPEADLCKQHAK